MEKDWIRPGPIHSFPNRPVEVRRGNTLANLGRLPDISALGQCLAGRRAVILGAGASMDTSWHEIIRLTDDGAAVIACDRMAAAAAEHVPLWGMVSLDSDPLAPGPVAMALDQAPGAVCLVASVCAPELVGEILKRRARGYTFLPTQDDYEAIFLESKADVATLSWCGSNVTVCAVALAMTLGAREIDVFGFDCRVDRGNYSTAVAGRGEPQTTIEMQVGGEQVLTTWAFALFVGDMIEIERLGRSQGLLDNLAVHGEGSLYSLLKPAKDAHATLKRKLEDGTYRRVTAACLCGDSGDGIPCANRDRDGFVHPMVMCEACGLIRARERLDADALGRFYRDDYRAVYGPGSAPAFATETGMDLSPLVEQLGISLNRVFEVGAGNGEFLDSLPPGELRHGSDLDPSTRFGNGDCRPLAGAYTLVAFHHCLEHLADPASALRDARAALAPGGAIYIGVPGLHRYRHDQLWQLAHLWQFEAATLEAFMRREGFEPLYIDEQITSFWRPT